MNIFFFFLFNTDDLSKMITTLNILLTSLHYFHSPLIHVSIFLEGDGLPDGDILECSVMVLRNNIKCFVIMQKEMVILRE